MTYTEMLAALKEGKTLVALYGYDEPMPLEYSMYPDDTDWMEKLEFLTTDAQCSIHVLEYGKLCLQYCGIKLPIQVCRSAAGFYIGCQTAQGEPYSRESREYYRTREEAEAALEASSWTQRDHP